MIKEYNWGPARKKRCVGQGRRGWGEGRGWSFHERAPHYPCISCVHQPRSFLNALLFVLVFYRSFIGLPWWLSSEKSACSEGDARDTGLIPGLGRSPGGGHGHPPQYSCLENAMDRGAWQATVHGVAKNQTGLKQLSTHTYRGFTTYTRLINSSTTGDCFNLSPPWKSRAGLKVSTPSHGWFPWQLTPILRCFAEITFINRNSVVMERGLLWMIRHPLHF